MGETIAFIGMIAVGLIILLIMTMIIRSNLRRYTVKVEATITDVVLERYYSGKNRHVPVYEYDFNGMHYRSREPREKETSVNSKQIGRKVNIFINPFKPTQTFRHADISPAYFVLGWSVIVIVIGAVNLIAGLF